MDFNEEVRWHNPLSWMQSLPSRESFNRASRQQRKTFPEIHMMKILEKQSGGKFKLEAPWGGVLDRVPCADFNIVSLLEPDMIVAVRYDIVDFHNCYIRNIAPSKIGVPSEIVVEPDAPETMYQHWVQAFGNPGLTRGRISAVWDPGAVGEVVWTGSGIFASVPHGIVFGGGLLITAQAVRNEANTAWEAVALYIGEDTYTAALGSSPSFLVGYGDLWCNVEGDLVLLRLGPHLQPLYRFRQGTFGLVTLTGLGSRVLSGMNASLTGKMSLGDVSRTYGGGGITLNFGGVPWPNVPTETVPTGTLVRRLQCWDLDTTLATIAEAWAEDPTDPSYFGLTSAWMNTGGTQRLAVANNTFVGAYAFRRRPLPSADGDHGLAVLWGWDEVLPGGNWSGEKLTENNTCSRELKAYLQAFLQTSGASVWQREIAVNVATLPVVSDNGILAPMTNFLDALVVSPDVFGGIINEGDITNETNGEGLLQPDTVDYSLPYRRFLDRPSVILFPASRNTVAPDDVSGNLSNLEVFHAWAATAGGTGEVVADAAGNSYWAFAYPVELLAAVGGMSRDEDFFGQFRWPGLGNQPVSTANEDFSYTLYHNPDFFPLLGRFVEKVSPTGALVWRANLTQDVAGLAWYATEATLGVPNTNVVGGEADSPHPLGDNIQWVRPCGRVVFVAADMRTLGPNYQPTLQVLILSEATGGLLHTVSLLLDDEVLAETVYGTGFTSATGDGVGVYFSLYVGEEIAEIIEVRIDGVPTVAYDLVINVDGFEITFYDPPADGAVIDIDYRLSEVVYRAGEYLYDVQSAEIRHGRTTEGTEWAVVFVIQQSREATPGNYPRTILIQMGANVSTPPTVTTHARTWTSPSTLALSNGQLVDLVWTGTEWTAVAY